MNRKLLVLVALLCAAVLLPAVATARPHYKVKVSIRYGVDSTLRGKVTSSKGRCFKQAKVVVRKKDGTILGSDFADKAGNWELFAPGLTALVRAEVGRTGTSLESGVSFVCDRTNSGFIAPVDI